MTIEEKAKEFAGYDDSSLRDCVVMTAKMIGEHDAFKAGANWMLEKAIYWLQEHVNDYIFDDGTSERPWLKCKSDMFDNFKKAMEE